MCILNLLTDSFMKMEQFFCALNMRLIKCQAVNINNGFFFLLIILVTHLTFQHRMHWQLLTFIYTLFVSLFVCFLKINLNFSSFLSISVAHVRSKWIGHLRKELHDAYNKFRSDCKQRSRVIRFPPTNDGQYRSYP